MNDTMTLEAPPVAPEGTTISTRGKPFADTFEAYVDGFSPTNPGPGGWAVVLRERNASGEPISTRIIFGSAEHATNNVMKLKAATMALASLPLDARGTVWSDSEYVVKGLNEWLPKWQQNGWRAGRGKSVANIPEWMTLIALWQQRPGVTFNWMRSHSGDSNSELAKAVARSEAEKVRAGLRPVDKIAVELSASTDRQP